MWPLRNIVEGLENGKPPAPSVARHIPQVGVKFVSQQQSGPNTSRPLPTKQRRTLNSRDTKHQFGHVNKYRPANPKPNHAVQKPRRPAAKAAASRSRFGSAQNPRERRQRVFERQTKTQKQLLERALTHLNKRSTLVKQIRNGTAETIVEPMGQKMLRGPPIDTSPQSSPWLQEDEELEPAADEPVAHKNVDASNGLTVGEVGSAWTTPGSSIVLTPNDSQQGLGEYSDYTSKKFASSQQAGNDSDVGSLVGRTLHDNRVEEEIEKRTYEWGECVTRMFQQKLAEQTRKFNYKSSSLRRKGNRAQKWAKKQFQRWIQELTDEIIELKQSGFVDERRTADLIRRHQCQINDLADSVSIKERKIARLTERYKIEMHLQRAKLKTLEVELEAASKEEAGIFEDIFKLQTMENETKQRIAELKKENKIEKDALAASDKQLQQVKSRLTALQKQDDIKLDPKLILAVKAMSQRWRKVKEATEGIFYDIACPYCIKMMRNPKTVDVPGLGGIVTMCSHCLTEKLKRKEVPPTALVMEHRRVQNIVKQIDEKVYLKQVKGIEDEIGRAEKLVGIVHSKWKKLKRLKKWGMLRKR